MIVSQSTDLEVNCTTADLQEVIANLESQIPEDRLYALRQTNIWVLQRTEQSANFASAGCIPLVVECLLQSMEDTPSCTSADLIHAATKLVSDFAKSGPEFQRAICFAGGVPILVALLQGQGSAAFQGYSQGSAWGRQREPRREAADAVAFLANACATARKELMLAGAVPVLVQALECSLDIQVRQHAAATIIGLASSSIERRLALLEAGAVPPLLELLVPDADSPAALTAAMNAAAALRYLCGEDSLAASVFCKARGLGIIASRIAREPDGDREILGLPGTLGVSCVRGECKSLMGDIYVSANALHQEQLLAVLEAHGSSLDRMVTTPKAHTASHGHKSSLEAGHKVLCCRTSPPTAKLPEIKWHLREREAAAKAAADGGAAAREPSPPVSSRGHVTRPPGPFMGTLGRVLTQIGCGGPNIRTIS